MTDKAEKWTQPWIVRADWSQTTGDAYVIDNEKSAEHDANLQLIASAPKLYGELFRALAVINSPESFEVEQVKADINCALRAARGEK